VAVVAAVAVILLAVGAQALAVPAPTGTQGQTILDPFRLTSITVSSMPEGQALTLRGARPAIRIPMRPPQRSAFRPMY